jgi:hypothetical protein
MHRRGEKCIKILVEKPERSSPFGMDIDRKIILLSVLKEARCEVMEWMNY